MGKKKINQAGDLLYYSSLGLQIALAIIIGYAAGYYLDTKVFHSSPWGTYIGLVLGIIAGFRNIWLAIKKIEKADYKE
jgi:ATP synthase protein I